IFALSVDKLDLTAGSPASLVTFSARGSALATATFTASYGRGAVGTTMHPETPTLAGFTLASNDIVDGKFKNDQTLNASGCSAGNKSPERHGPGAPPDTQSFALTVYDPDAPTGSGFWHWLAFDIPATATSLPNSAGAAGVAIGGTGAQGYNDAAIE